MKYAVTKNHDAGLAYLTLMGPAEVITEEMLVPLISEWVKHKTENPQEFDDRLWELHIQAQSTVVRDDLPFYFTGIVNTLKGQRYWIADLSPVDHHQDDPNHTTAVFLVADGPN